MPLCMVGSDQAFLPSLLKEPKTENEAGGGCGDAGTGATSSRQGDKTDVKALMSMSSQVLGSGKWLSFSNSASWGTFRP